jgi:hypothetical protein
MNNTRPGSASEIEKGDMSSDSFEISEYGFASYDRFMQN